MKNKLEDKDKLSQDFFRKRLEELKAARQNVGGINLENIWRAADKAYIPHNTEQKGTKVFASDDETGWRSRQIVIGNDEWQEDSVPPNAYIKIQTALGILIDRNPEGVFNPGNPQYESNSLLMENLYKRSWDIARSKQQLKIFVYNLAKYGWSPARTYPLIIKRKTRDIIHYDPLNTKNNTYKDSEVTLFDDIYREALNPWHVWIDDGAKPSNQFSVNDWCYFKDYSKESFDEQFGHLAIAKTVVMNKQPEQDEPNPAILQKENTVRLWFYENLEKDMFYIETDNQNGSVVLVNEPIPFSPKNKRLSLWQTYWTIRDDKSAYGIGIYEAMRNDAKILTKVRNMTIDQLLLSIYKMGFHSGSNNLDGNGDIPIKPGIMQQLIDPSKVAWMEIPGPGRDAMEMMKFLEEKLEDDTGITKTIEGEVTGKTAFEVAQSREFALKRLRIPLENITDALEQDAYITVSLIEEIYSIPKVMKLGSRRLIENYREEILQSPELFAIQGDELTVKQYRQVQLGLEENQDGEMKSSDIMKFFTLMPEKLSWEGVINVNPQSVLFESEILMRQMKLELANQLVPLFAGPPEINLKPAKQLLKLYKEDPNDWLPDIWLQPSLGAAQGNNPQLGNQASLVSSGEPQTPFIVPQSEQLTGQNVPQ